MFTKSNDARAKILIVGDSNGSQMFAWKCALLQDQCCLTIVSSYLSNKMRYLLDDIEEVIDYRAIPIVRSVEVLAQCFSRVLPPIIFDIIIISSSTCAQYRQDMMRLQRYTTEETLIMVDGALGANFEGIVHEAVPECVVLAFTCDCMLKFTGNSTYVCDNDGGKVTMNIGSSSITQSKNGTAIYEQALTYLRDPLNQDDHFHRLVQRLMKVNTFANIVLDTSEVYNMKTFVWYNTVTLIAVDCLAIIFDDYTQDYDDRTKVAVVSSVYDELLYLALQCGALNLHNAFRLSENRYESLNNIALTREKIKVSCTTNPPFTNATSTIYYYMNYMETYTTLALQQCLITADIVGVNCSSLSFLHALVETKIKSRRPYEPDSQPISMHPRFTGSLLRVPTSSTLPKGLLYKRRKRNTKNKDKFFETNETTESEGNYEFDENELEHSEIGVGFSGKETEDYDSTNGSFRYHLTQFSNNELINLRYLPTEDPFRQIDIFSFMLEQDVVKNEAKEAMLKIKMLKRRIGIRDEFIYHHNLWDELLSAVESIQSEEEINNPRKFEENLVEEDDIKRLVLAVEHSGSLYDEDDGQEIIGNPQLTKHFTIGRKPTKLREKLINPPNNPHVKKILTMRQLIATGASAGIGIRSAKTGACDDQQTVSLFHSKKRVLDPVLSKKNKTFEYSTYNGNHQNIISSLDGLCDDLVKKDRYKVANSIKNKNCIHHPTDQSNRSSTNSMQMNTQINTKNNTRAAITELTHSPQSNNISNTPPDICGF